jgi:hypothetical protein
MSRDPRRISHSTAITCDDDQPKKLKGLIMDNLDDNLEIMLDENTGHHAYTTATAAVFRDLARAYADRKEVQGRRIMVVTSAADFDTVALPLGGELQALGAWVNYSCVSYAWYTWDDGRHDPNWRATYRETFEDSDFDIVVAMSVVTEPVELLTVAKAALVGNVFWDRETPLDYTSLGVIVAATVPGVQETLNSIGNLKQSSHNRAWIAGTIETSIRHTGPVSPSMKRAGVVDTLKSSQVYPQSLLPSGTHNAIGRWEGSRPTRPGFISGEEDMLHDLEEIDRRDAGVLTSDKRHLILDAAEVLGYSASDEEGVSELSSMYDVKVEDVRQVLSEARVKETTPVQSVSNAETATKALGEDAIVAAAVAEFKLAHPMEGQAEECGRRAAIRGMMVRLGLYDKLLKAANNPS